MSEQELRDLRAKALKTAQDLNDKTLKENRDFTAEEHSSYDKMIGDIKAYDAQIQQLTRAKQLEGFSALPPPLQETKAAPAPQETREAQEQSAFSAFLKTREIRTASDGSPLLTITTDVNGGSVWAPTKFVNELIKDLEKDVLIYQRVRKINIPQNTGNTLSFPVQTADASDADWKGEIDQASKEKDWAFGTKQLTTYRLVKEIVMSRLQLAVSVTDIASMIRAKLSEVLARTIENAVLTGTGTSQPLGIFADKAFGADASGSGDTTRDIEVGILPASATNASALTKGIQSDDLITVKQKLRPGYKKNAVWVFHPDVLTDILLLKDNNGQYLWRPGLTQGQGDTILGLPIIESEFAPKDKKQGGFCGLLADFSNYWMLQLGGVQMQVLNEIYAEKNQTAYLATMNLGGSPIQKEGFVRIKYKKVSA